MTQPSSSCNPIIVWEFYAIYTSSVYLVTPTKGRAVDQSQLTHTLVRRVKVYILVEAVKRVPFGTEYVCMATTFEFD